MPKSFHITNQAKAQQLEETNNGLWIVVKAIFMLIILTFVFREPESVLAIDLPSISLPAFSGNPNDNERRFTSSNNPYGHDGSNLNLILDWVR
jgi:hypothetical protein